MKVKVFPCSLDDVVSTDYSLAIASSGYESRGRYFWEKHLIPALAKTSFIFSDHQVLDYNDNRKFFTENNFELIAADQDAIKLALAKWDQNTANPDQEFRVIVDISCMTRLLIAATCYELAQLASRQNKSVVVNFIYTCAAFGEIPDIDGPICVNGPAIPALAGWPKHPSHSLGVIIGIGYEEDLALGVIEELEAANVWVFRPKDHDPRYEEEIEKRNRGLFDEIPATNLIRYSLSDPFSSYASIEALIGLEKNDSKLLVVPLGPKIFALISCLATLAHHPNVGYWRVSSGENLAPVERRADGKIISIQARFFS